MNSADHLEVIIAAVEAAANATYAAVEAEGADPRRCASAGQVAAEAVLSHYPRAVAEAVHAALPEIWG